MARKRKGITCTRCSKRLTTETALYSDWTGNYYCQDIDACSKRAKTKQRKEEREARLQESD